MYCYRYTYNRDASIVRCIVTPLICNSCCETPRTVSVIDAIEINFIIIIIIIIIKGVKNNQKT